MKNFYQKICKVGAFSLFALSLSTPLMAQKAVDLTAFDKSVKPQDDFFSYVNGSWLKTAQIPASEGAWGSFYELGENNRQVLNMILEDALKQRKTAQKGSDWQLVGDFYASGMDTETLNKLGYKPLESELKRIDDLKNTDDLLKLMASYHNLSIGNIFGLFVSVDAKNSQFNTLYLSQSGLSLPSRDYYLDESERFAKIREDYTKFIAKMFVMTGTSQAQAELFAQKVLKMEKRLAEAQRTPVQNRDPQRRYNKMSIEQLNQLCFNIDWKKYLDYVGVKSESLIVSQPEFIGMADRMLTDYKIEDWKIFFRWKLINSASNSLSEDFEKANFDFYSTSLRGISEMRPRWKRIQGAVNGNLGEALGRLYVQKTFPPEAKKRMEEMIINIKEAMAERIKKLDWMGEATKEQALKKLAAIVYKIGYPDKWKDYTMLDIKANDYFGNQLQITTLETKRNWEKVGKAVDKTEWGMTPPTVNAYYSPTRNEIVFPAGILQAPFFNFKADDAVNYGGIGAVIGHEITHGFDDQGSQYDAEGNLKMWWTAEDRQKFEAKANMVVEQYNNYKVLDTVNVNGKLTLGENIADYGGLTIAYEALQRSFAKNGRPKKKIDGFTPEQRFFIGFAQVWKGKYRNEVLLERIKTDPHSPGEYRTNGALSNMPQFFEAFDVKEGDKMRRKITEIPAIW